jgi:sugar phosphate isomerase/epimerase
MISRRDFGRVALGGAALAAAGAGLARAAAPRIDSTVAGVRLGVCMYCFRDMPRPADQDRYIDMFVDATVKSGAGFVEINSPYLEPANDLPFQGIPRIQDAVQRPREGAPVPKWMTMSPAELQAARETLRRWRLNTPASYFTNVRRKFVDAGVTPFSYVFTFTPDMTDAEIDAIFKQAQALGVNVFSTNQTKVEMAPRLAPFAERYRMDLGFHNHTAVANPNEVASVESLEKIFAVSPRMKSNLDVGHFVAANNDPVAFLRRHPDRITHLHMKDRKRDEGPGTVWGEGDAPLKELLVIIRDQKLPIPAIVEYEYRGTGTGLEETIKCMNFMRTALTA